MKQNKGARAITVRSLDTFVGPGRLRVGPKSVSGDVEIWRWQTLGVPVHETVDRGGFRDGVRQLPDRVASARPTEGRRAQGRTGEGGRSHRGETEKRAAAARTATTFRTALDAYCDAPAYRSKAATATLIERLARHAAGLMQQPLDAIDSARVAKALAKVHESAPHTGRRALAGIARVFDYARVKGLIDAQRPNPATFRGTFEHLWGPPEPTRHWRAVSWEQVPDLYSQLCDLDDMTSAWCLRFLILTGVRTKNALYARFNQIDLNAATWTIEPENMKKNEKMKARPAFVVPLVDEAVAIVTTMRDRRPAGELVFRPTDTSANSRIARSPMCCNMCWGSKRRCTGFGHRCATSSAIAPTSNGRPPRCVWPISPKGWKPPTDDRRRWRSEG